MKDYDATEVAFKNGQTKGDAEGYQRGFGDGLAAAGIAPIQWVDAMPAVQAGKADRLCADLPAPD